VVDPPSDVMDLRSANLDSKNSRCRTSTPPRRRGNVTAIKDDGGIELTRPIIEKISLQVLYPRGGRGNGTPIEDDGGGSMSMSAAEKIIAAGPLPPRREESFQVGKGVEGGVNDEDQSAEGPRKKFRSSSSNPTTGFCTSRKSALARSHRCFEFIAALHVSFYAHQKL
jgi:hypothetical protein